MLITGRKLSVGAISFASHVAIERTFRLYGVERTNTVWDTRFVRTHPRADGGPRVVFFLLDGWIRWHADRAGELRAPAVFAASRDPLEGMSAERDRTRSAGGNPYRALQLTEHGSHATGEDVLLPITAPEQTFAAAREVMEKFPADPTRAIIDFLERCGEAGLVDRGLAKTVVAKEAAPVRRLWDAFSELYMTKEPIPPLQTLADHAGVSARQLARDVERVASEFGLEWDNFRELATDVRLRWAALLLSYPKISIAKVASAAGFASNDALAKAFRQAGLPSPRDVRRMTLERS